MEISWLKSFADGWSDRVLHARVPHAVLLAGPPGTGKRAAACWIGSRFLELPVADLPEHPVARPEHADLHWIAPEEDKKTVGIEQIRALVHEMGLTSYEGGGKVAIIEPANAMTVNAANSLLKTLEEPPGDALLVLVADRVGHLPATVFSRCQRIDFAPPSEADGLAWLDRLQPGASWIDALRAAGCAPLAAIGAIQELETAAGMARDMNALGRGQGSAVEVAGRWAKIEPTFVLNWLSQQVRLGLIALSAGRESAAGIAIDDSVLRRMDSRNLFCYLDIINRLRGQAAGSWNPQLTFESLLIDWADGLRDCSLDAPMDGLNLIMASR
ncbi:MAG: hypothetical protein QNJ14_04855 [Woeseiaceae bacterium]|nr:hypothetical protein [Woeseiaceae bacterium]